MQKRENERERAQKKNQGYNYNHDYPSTLRHSVRSKLFLSAVVKYSFCTRKKSCEGTKVKVPFAFMRRY